MNHCCVFILFMLLSYGSAVSQNQFVTLEGTILDAENRLPISYANISVSRSKQGVVSNVTGDFRLVIPLRFMRDTLLISHIGYKTHRQSIGALAENRTNTIMLEAITTVLSEITVSSDGARTLVTKALEQIPEVYSTTPYLLEGFQRTWEKIEFTDSLTYPGTLIEAAFAVYDPGYSANPKRRSRQSGEQVYLLEVRRSALMPGWIYKGNMLQEILQQNLVRHTGSKFLFVESFLNFPNTLDYEWVSRSEIDGQPVDVIEVRYPNDRKFPVTYRVFITEKEKAIVRFDLFGASHDIDFSRPWHTDSLDVSYTFRQIDGKFYLNYARMKYTISNIDVKSQKVVRKEFYSKEIMINNVITTDVQEVRKSLGDPSARKSLALQAKSYNASFWENYNMLNENPADKNIIELFERNGKLENQFSDSTMLKDD